MRAKIGWMAAFLLPGLLVTTGCEWTGAATETEEVRATYPLREQRRLWVETFNGTVEIQGADRADVKLVAVKRAVSRRALEVLDVKVAETPEGLRIRASRPSGYRGPAGVNLTLEVPREAVLEMVRSSNGRIQVENIRGTARLRTSNGEIEAVGVGAIEASTSNGKIVIRDAAGRVEAATSNGRISVEDARGDCDLRTSNGTIEARRVQGSVMAQTSNGSIRVEILRPGAEPVRLETANGAIEATFHAVPVAGAGLVTRNASITLRLPRQAQARIDARLTHGGFSVDLPLKESLRTKDRLEGTLGDGGPLIRLETTNGSIRLEALAQGG